MSSFNQVHEISNKLVELAKQKKVEEEMAELTRHKNKISELQQRIAKLTCNSLSDVRNEQTLQAAALIYGLAEKLAIQVGNNQLAELYVYLVSMLRVHFCVEGVLVSRIVDQLVFRRLHY